MAAKKRKKKTNSAKPKRQTGRRKKPRAKKQESAKTKHKRKKAKPSSKHRTKTRSKKASRPAGEKNGSAVEDMLEKELREQGQELFSPKQKGLMSWVRKYSPVLITLGIGLATYFFLVMYLFYPSVLLYGHYMQLLILLVFVFLIAGILIYLGLRAELMFVRVLSFIFVFVIFTFLLLFILLAYTMRVPA